MHGQWHMCYGSELSILYKPGERQLDLKAVGQHLSKFFQGIVKLDVVSRLESVTV